MAKKTFTINDFSLGINGFVDPLNIDDSEVAQSQNFQAEPGVIKILGNMKIASTPAAANANTSVEPGYGLFAFSHDYDRSGGLSSTNYLIMMDGLTFDEYNDDDDDWSGNVFNVGARDGAATPSSVKPCFYILDGDLRISAGNFSSVDSGGDLIGTGTTGDFAATTVYGDFEAVVTNSGFDGLVDVGDTIVINGQEMIVLVAEDAALTAGRNLTGLFPSIIDATVTDDVSVVMETRWYGVVKRRNFPQSGIKGTFTEWYYTYQHPRAPVEWDSSLNASAALTSRDTFPFTVRSAITAVVTTGATPPSLNIGLTIDEPHADSAWDATNINIYVTALYDEIKQESQPHKTVSSQAIAAGMELGIYLNVNYYDADIADFYQINKRVTGARIYYEDINTDPGNLYQLVESDFELGCKKAGAEEYTPWNEKKANEIVESHAGGHDAAERTTTNGSAFIFVSPPKTFTYEINTGYPPSVNTHARYKTAVMSNNRVFIGNVYQSGKAHGDRMISSPPFKFDLFPEIEPNVSRATAGDGDEIVKLEAYADRVLQFKKRTLYIINVSGGLGEDFVEGQYKNMGVENPSQTCMTEYGVAWVNSHGVYTYDGQDITDLTIQKLQITSSTSSRALNVTEAYVPSIGYHPANKWLVVHPQSTVTGTHENEAWIYDFKSGSWSFSSEFTDHSNYKTNMVWPSTNELLFFSGTNSSNSPNSWIYGYTGADYSSGEMLFLTKAFDLGLPGIKKKLRSVFITYKASASTYIEADVIYRVFDSGTTTNALEQAAGATNLYTEALGLKTTGGAVKTVELVPTTYVTAAHTFQLKLHNPDAAYPYGAALEIYDISFVYRPLGIR